MSAVAALLLPALALALELYLHRNGLPVIWRRNTLAWSLLWLLPAAFAGGLWLLHDVESGTGFFATYVFAKIWLCAYVPYLHRAAARFKLPDTLGRHMRCCALAAVAGLLPLLCALTALADTFAAPVLHLLLAAFGGYTAWRLLEHAERPDHARTERQARTLLHRWFPVCTATARTQTVARPRRPAASPPRFSRRLPDPRPPPPAQRPHPDHTGKLFGSSRMDGRMAAAASPARRLGVFRTICPRVQRPVVRPARHTHPVRPPRSRTTIRHGMGKTTGRLIVFRLLQAAAELERPPV
nr:hypothetical protein LVJ77_11895 [Conchiformibius kuhniae]